jgi:hypothetical protein
MCIRYYDDQFIQFLRDSEQAMTDASLGRMTCAEMITHIKSQAAEIKDPDARAQRMIEVRIDAAELLIVTDRTIKTCG